jgi:hypothetical protein
MNERSTIPAPPKFIASPSDNDNVPSVPTANDEPGTSVVDSDKQQTPAPPPKFSAPPPPFLQHNSRPATDPAKAAVLAAAKAAQHATPAQRERMVMEAAAQALAQRTAAAAAENNTETTPAPAPAPAAPLGPYEPPFWASHPPTMPFYMEVMKQGTIISSVNLQQLCIDANKGFLTLGRAPTNDLLLDHPSSSRIHAVLEFRSSSKQEDGEPSDSDVNNNTIFLFDPGSTHGCYVNKARIAAGQHIPLNIGDMLRFGESSRIMILCGPAELMVEEGPSREQRKQAAALEALKRRKEKDAAAAKLAMAKAIAANGSGGGGVSWGFGEDARGGSDEENDDGRYRSKEAEIDWREHASKKGLSDKQQKFADKIRKREARIMHLQKESGKIQSKQQSMEEMSAGQASTLARNDEEVEKARIEIEELEDQLVASIEDSISGNKIAGAGGKRNFKGGKKRGRGGGGGGGGPDEDSEHGDDSDEDSFYDRTKKRAAGREKTRTVKTVGGGSKNGDVFEDAASLYGTLEALKEEKVRVEALLVAETTKIATINTNNKRQEHCLDATAVASPLHNPFAAAADGNDVTAAVDSLDDFMAAVESAIESDRAAILRKELSQIESKILTNTNLLKIADPDNFYKPGSKAANSAAFDPVQRARKAIHIEQERKKAEERQKREALAAKVAKEMVFVAEEEEESKVETGEVEMEKAKQSSLHQLTGEGEEKDPFSS